MNPYNLLSEPIKKFIYEKEWTKFTKIQNAAIPRIIETDNNYILSSKTGSGKTEAVFLPLLSMINSDEYGIKILYISPTIALINDQFKRVEELCEYLDIQITKWHSEASYSNKKKIIKAPSGIILITPESIEAMFIHHPEYISKLFFDLKFIITDEIHIFINSDRGTHLRSLLYRLRKYIPNSVRYMGMSATLGNFQVAKDFFGNYEKTRILIDESKKPVNVSLKYFEFEKKVQEKQDYKVLPDKLLKQVYKETKKIKSLIFPNTRAKVEYLAVKLRKINKDNKGTQNYFSHHASVSKNIREYVEKFAKLASYENFGICCTSTLELGIDIGSVDLIAQVDSTFSVASMTQRLGRSGRTEESQGFLNIYVTDKWNLLQSLAIFLLMKDGFIEPFKPRKYSINICFHQILSILKESFGKTREKLLTEIRSNYIFKNIKKKDVILLIENMKEKGFIEFINNELIFGLEAERFIRNRTIYTMFTEPIEYQVFFKDTKIGFLPVVNTVYFEAGINLYLAAKIWKVESINHEVRKIYVSPEKKGKPPKFPGSGLNVHEKVRIKMLELLTSQKKYSEIDKESQLCLSKFRDEFSSMKIKNVKYERPMKKIDKQIQFYTFTSTKINKTLNILLKIIEVEFSYNEFYSLFVFRFTDFDFNKLRKKLLKLLENFEDILNNINPNKMYLMANEFFKWSPCLPIKLIIKMLIADYFDVEGTKLFLEKINIQYLN